jgi:hypothetical protein
MVDQNKHESRRIESEESKTAPCAIASSVIRTAKRSKDAPLGRRKRRRRSSSSSSSSSSSRSSRTQEKEEEIGAMARKEREGNGLEEENRRLQELEASMAEVQRDRAKGISRIRGKSVLLHITVK